MAFDLKYGQLDIPGIGEHEPVFVLRAKDQLAVTAVEQYRDLYFDESQMAPVSTHDAERFISLIDKVVELFESWRLKNKKLIKLPD